MTDVNYDLYPSQELQRDWLTAYLESYKHGSGREVTVTEAEVTRLYHHVCKFSLVSVQRVIKRRGNTAVISSALGETRLSQNHEISAFQQYPYVCRPLK